MKNKVYVLQEEIDTMTDCLLDKIKQSNKEYSCVVGIANGGLNISRKIAESLCLQHKIIYISCYDKENKKECPTINGDHPGNNCLVVDDLVDSGETFNLYRQHYGDNNHFAVLYWNTKSPKPHYYVKEKPNKWIVLPWE